MSGIQQVTIVNPQGQKAEWATEKTLQDLVNVLNPNAKKTLSPDAKAVQDALGEVSDATGKLEATMRSQGADNKVLDKMTTDEQRKAWIAQTEATAKSKILGQNMRDLTQTVGRSFSNPDSVLNAFSGGLGGLANSLHNHARSTNGLTDETKEKFLGLSQSITMLSKVVGVFAKGYETMMKVNKGFLDMYDSGMRFQGGMSGMMSSVMQTGLSLDQFSKVTKNNVQATAMFSTSTPRVIKSFMDLTGQGGALMMSQEQAADAFMSASEIYQNSGLRQGLTDQQLSQRTSQLIKDINGLSQATGQSRTDILKFVNDTFKKPETIALMSTLPTQMQEGFKEFTKNASLLGGTAAKTLTSMMEKMLTGKGTLGLLDENQQLMMAAIPELRKGMQKFAETGEMTTENMREMGDSIANIDPRRLSMIMASLPPEVGAFVGSIQQFRKQEQARLKVREEEIQNLMKYGMSRETAEKRLKQDEDNQRNTQEAINKTQAEFNKSWMAIELSLLQVGKVVLQVMRPFAEVLGGLASVVGVVSDAWDKLITPLTSGINSLGKFGDVINFAINAVELFVIGLAANKIMGGGGIRSVGKRLMGGTARMAKGLPGMLSGLLGGGAVAAGETALASEAVLGGGALTGGLGIAGKTLAKRIPLLGGAVAGGLELASSGDWKKSLFVGGGSILGGLGGGAIGSALLPGAGTVAGGIAGAYGGEKLGEALYDKMFGASAQSVNNNNTSQNYQQSADRWQTDVFAVFTQMNSYLQNIDKNIKEMRVNAQGPSQGDSNWRPSLNPPG